MNCWLSPTIKNVTLNSKFGEIDLFTSESIKGDMIIDIPKSEFYKVRTQILNDSQFSIPKEDINIRKDIPHVDRRLEVKLNEEAEFDVTSYNSDNTEKTFFVDSEVSRETKMYLSEELLNRERARPDSGFKTPVIHVSAGALNLESLSWLKAVSRKMTVRKLSALEKMTQAAENVLPKEGVKVYQDLIDPKGQKY